MVANSGCATSMAPIPATIPIIKVTMWYFIAKPFSRTNFCDNTGISGHNRCYLDGFQCCYQNAVTFQQLAADLAQFYKVNNRRARCGIRYRRL